MDNRFIPSTYFIPVKINGFNYLWQREFRRLWTADMQGFAILRNLTSNEKQQLNDQLRSRADWYSIT